MSPESIVNTGLSEASKKPRCTVVGDALSSCIFSSHGAAVPERTTMAPRQKPKAFDLMIPLLWARLDDDCVLIRIRLRRKSLRYSAVVHSTTFASHLPRL